MRIKLLCCLMVFLLALPVVAEPPKDYTAPSVALIDNTPIIDVNRILMFVTNHGNFGRDLAGVFGYDYGTFWPYAGDTAAVRTNTGKAGDFSPNYAAGLWIGGKVGAEYRVIISEYSSEYVPGPMLNGTYQTDRPEFRVYKLFRDSLEGNPNQDYLDWPVDQGAPVDDDGNPEMIGDQMLWCVYNDASGSAHDNDAGSTSPLGIEVKQTVFGFDRLGSLGDMVFVRYRIFNKGSNVIDSCFFSIWYDPDMGGSTDDYVGCDTLTDLGFCYNADNDDSHYGSSIPAIGCDFFQGPLIFTGDDADTALMWDFTEYPQYRNMGLTSFNKYINGTDPDNFTETFGFMKGLTKEGTDYIYNGQVLKFVHTGDPAAGVGDLDLNPADRRWMQTTGPITFSPGDSTEIVIAEMVSRGSNNLTSVTAVKNLDVFAQKIYEDQFNPPKAPAKPVVTIAAVSGEVTLSWGDTSEVDQGEFPFEGYTVWQGEGPAGPWHLLGTYDIVNDREDAVEPLIDTLFDPESGLNLPVVMRSVKNSGLRYHYRTTMDALTNTPLRDLTPYYYRVTAFSFGYFKLNGDAVPNGDRFLESATSVVARPASPLAGVHPQASTQNILTVTHPYGASDGVIEPIVVDPAALTGHQYRISFRIEINEDEEEVPVWDLYDMDLGEYVIEGWDNQETNDDFLVVDGILLKVQGPPPGFKEFQVVANADGLIDPPEPGAMWFGDFPVPTEYDPDGYISERQQVTDPGGQWGVHTADNGGTNIGTRCCIDAFYSRCLRDGGNNAALGGVDYEMRFTGSYDDPEVNGSWGIQWYGDRDTAWAPFELWETGVATPDDPSDDVKLIWFIIDDGDDDTYNLESYGSDDPTSTVPCNADCEHSVSGGFNDPYTDWVYWIRPIDNSPGTAGYDAAEVALLSGTFASEVNDDGLHYGEEIMARTVLVSWNGGNEPPFVQDLPEQGTIFRIITNKPNFPADTFYFTAPAPVLTATESDLDQIKAVPNPFYLTGGYDPNPGSYSIKFHHLPATCTISIYNLAGELVRVIDKDDAATAEAVWDVLTENGLPVGSGIYIYVVDAPGFGQKIGKMAVFVEQEVLDIY